MAIKPRRVKGFAQGYTAKKVEEPMIGLSVSIPLLFNYASTVIKNPPRHGTF